MENGVVLAPCTMTEIGTSQIPATSEKQALDSLTLQGSLVCKEADLARSQ